MWGVEGIRDVSILSAQIAARRRLVFSQLVER